MIDPVLTADDLPTLRRLVDHFHFRARHRRFGGYVVCEVVAKVLATFARHVEEHGVVHPAIDYGRVKPSVRGGESRTE